MTEQLAEEAHRTGRSVRLDTLVRLRWLAVIGQTTAVLVVYFRNRGSIAVEDVNLMKG